MYGQAGRRRHGRDLCTSSLHLYDPYHCGACSLTKDACASRVHRKRLPHECQIPARPKGQGQTESVKFFVIDSSHLSAGPIGYPARFGCASRHRTHRQREHPLCVSALASARIQGGDVNGKLRVAGRHVVNHRQTSILGAPGDFIVDILVTVQARPSWTPSETAS